MTGSGSGELARAIGAGGGGGDGFGSAGTILPSRVALRPADSRYLATVPGLMPHARPIARSVPGTPSFFASLNTRLSRSALFVNVSNARRQSSGDRFRPWRAFAP